MKKGILAVCAAVLLFVLIAVMCAVFHNTHANKPVETLPDEKSSVAVRTVEDPSIRYKVPESPASETFEASLKEDKLLYSDTSICAVFGDDIRQFCTDSFGEYLAPLQEPYRMLEDAGYEYFVVFNSDDETVVKRDNYLEFNIYLPGNRGRFTISKKGKTYTTTFTLLKEDEYLQTYIQDAGDDEADSMYRYYTSKNQLPMMGYKGVNNTLDNSTYAIFDSEQIDEAFSSDVLYFVRLNYGSSSALQDTINFLYSVGMQDSLSQATYDNGKIICGDYLCKIIDFYGDIATDFYRRE